MTFVHTFYSDPVYKNKFNDFETSLNNILWDYSVSLLFVKQFGYKIKLFTDKRGKELLSFLPYDEIIVLDNVVTSTHFAAAFKFYAMQQCDLNDVIIDGDIILDTQKVYDIVENSKADLLCSFVEPNSFILKDFCPNPYYETNNAYYEDLIKRINVSGVRYTFPELSKLKWPNTSLIKFNNQKMKDEWVDQYLYHLNLLKDKNFEHTWPDIIVEQYFLEKIIEQGNYSFDTIIKNYPNLTNEERYLGFTHLGSSKPICLQLMKDVLMREDILLYNKVIKKFNEEMTKYNKG